MAGYLDGIPVFGYAVSITEQPSANSHQINTFFGVDGNQSLYGGTRGRTFLCSGVLMASSAIGIESAKQSLLSFSDGLTHILTDSYGNVWPNVIMTNEFQWQGPPRPMACYGFGSGYGRAYRLTLTGLS